jgi:flagellar motility protein MotE (MotC chaperone)
MIRAATVACFLAALTTSQARTASAEEAHAAPAAAEAFDYCKTFGNRAAEARNVLQKEEIQELKKSAEETLKLLDERTAELEDLLKKREELIAATTASIVKMYEGMETEAAAEQLQKLEIRQAGEILRRLSAKASGEIVAAMKPSAASRLVAYMLAENIQNTEKK